MKAFTAREVQRQTGAGYRHLDHLARTGALQPSVATASGRGSRRLYSTRDIIAVRFSLVLQQAGVERQTVTRVARYVQESATFSDEESLKGQVLVVDEDSVHVVKPEQLPALCGSGRHFVVMPLDNVVGDVPSAEKPPSKPPPRRR